VEALRSLRRLIPRQLHRAERRSRDSFLGAFRDAGDWISRPRAATDLKTIRTRVEELRRERRPDHRARTPDSKVAGHRGRCAYRMSPFPDECDGLCKAFSLGLRGPDQITGQSGADPARAESAGHCRLWSPVGAP